MKAIYKRELKSYFDSMIGYVFVAFVTAFIGIYFLAYNMYGGYPYFSYALRGSLSIMLLAVPVLTMKSFAEERKSKTDQMLLTAPVSLTGIVAGKYLAMMTVLGIPMLISCICPLIIKMHGTAYLFADYSSIVAFYLMCGALIAIGMFISSLTESQIIAAVGTFAVTLVLYLWNSLLEFLPASLSGTGFASLLSNLYIGIGFENFAYNNIFDVTGLIGYISVIFIFAFLTVQVLSKRRWS